jgi:hypothetical protein
MRIESDILQLFYLSSNLIILVARHFAFGFVKGFSFAFVLPRNVHFLLQLLNLL